MWRVSLVLKRLSLSPKLYHLCILFLQKNNLKRKKSFDEILQLQIVCENPAKQNKCRERERARKGFVLTFFRHGRVPGNCEKSHSRFLAKQNMFWTWELVRADSENIIVCDCEMKYAGRNKLYDDKCFGNFLITLQ